MCAIKDVKLLILDFFQKGLDEIFFNGWILIPACEDCTKLKRNLQLSKNRPGGSQDPQCTEIIAVIVGGLGSVTKNLDDYLAKIPGCPLYVPKNLPPWIKKNLARCPKTAIKSKSKEN